MSNAHSPPPITLAIATGPGSTVRTVVPSVVAIWNAGASEAQLRKTIIPSVQRPMALILCERVVVMEWVMVGLPSERSTRGGAPRMQTVGR